MCKDEMQRWRRDDIWREPAMEVELTLGRMGARSAVRRSRKEPEVPLVTEEKGRSHQIKKKNLWHSQIKAERLDVMCQSA